MKYINYYITFIKCLKSNVLLKIHLMLKVKCSSKLGGERCKIKNNFTYNINVITPIAHTSHFSPYVLLSMISGATTQPHGK